MGSRGVQQVGELRELALAMPEAWEDHPWGETVVKVGKKIFVFLGMGDEPAVTMKLPVSHEQALTAPGATPTGYGLGKAGWVTVPLAKRGSPTLGVLEDWLEESYIAVAPKKLGARLIDGR